MQNSSIVTGKTDNDNNIISILAIRKYETPSTGKDDNKEMEVALQNQYIYYNNLRWSGKIKPSILMRDIDLYAWRNFTDIVIQGSAKSNVLTKNLTVGLFCRGRRQKFSRAINIVGDRWVEKGRTGLQLTSPEPFTEMPMRYDKAYGGTDERAEKKYANHEELEFFRMTVGEEEDQEISEYSYPRNPAGKGYLIDPEGLVGLQWPNLEFPNDMLTLENVIAPLDKWGNQPYPACFDWFPHAWFPRVAFFGEFPPTHDGKVPQKEVDMGILDKNFHLKPLLGRPKQDFAQGAHPCLWGVRLQGDEELWVTHMAKDGRDFYLKLPNEVPKITIKLFDGKKQNVKPELVLLFMETEKNTVTLLWRGTVSSGKKFLPSNWQNQCEYNVSW